MRKEGFGEAVGACGSPASRDRAALLDKGAARSDRLRPRPGLARWADCRHAAMQRRIRGNLDKPTFRDRAITGGRDPQVGRKADCDLAALQSQKMALAASRHPAAL